MELAPLGQVKAFARFAPPALDFAAALTAQPGASLIAEVKRASPSKGVIAQEWDPEQIAETYARNGAAAISCLTDSRFFQGNLEYLTEIKERLRVIGKRRAGAAQGLRLPRVPGLRGAHGRRRCHAAHRRRAGRQRSAQPARAGREPGHGRAGRSPRRGGDCDRALDSDAEIIGVNNRDLRDLPGGHRDHRPPARAHPAGQDPRRRERHPQRRRRARAWPTWAATPSWWARPSASCRSQRAAPRSPSFPPPAGRSTLGRPATQHGGTP